MPFYGKRRNYRKKTNAKKRTYKKRSGVSPATKRYVKRTIHSQIENKQQVIFSSQQVITSYERNNSLLVASMIPYSNISQGVGQQRIGNVIRTMRCSLSYAIFPVAYSVSQNYTPQPQEVILMFGKVKNSKAIPPAATDFAKLYNEGSTNRSPFSNLLDLCAPLNKDWFTIYKVMKHKIGTSSYSGTGSTPAAHNYQNNDFKLNVVRTLDLTKHCPKKVQFNDTSAQPTNDGLFMWAMCVNADGSINNYLNTPIGITYSINYTYEDA